MEGGGTKRVEALCPKIKVINASKNTAISGVKVTFQQLDNQGKLDEAGQRIETKSDAGGMIDTESLGLERLSSFRVEVECDGYFSNFLIGKTPTLHSGFNQVQLTPVRE
jgi:hypothetical protein